MNRIICDFLFVGDKLCPSLDDEKGEKKGCQGSNFVMTCPNSKYRYHKL